MGRFSMIEIWHVTVPHPTTTSSSFIWDNISHLLRFGPSFFLAHLCRFLHIFRCSESPRHDDQDNFIFDFLSFSSIQKIWICVVVVGGFFLIYKKKMRRREKSYYAGWSRLTMEGKLSVIIYIFRDFIRFFLIGWDGEGCNFYLFIYFLFCWLARDIDRPARSYNGNKWRKSLGRVWLGLDGWRRISANSNVRHHVDE
jgi:hypothetical protein